MIFSSTITLLHYIYTLIKKNERKKYGKRIKKAKRELSLETLIANNR